MKTNKSGISLLLLVIVMVVMIVIAGVVVLIVNIVNSLETANKLALQNDLRIFQDKLELYKINKEAKEDDFLMESLYAYSNSLNYNTITEAERKGGNIFTILPEAEKYGDKIYIEAGELIFSAKGKEIAWVDEIGVKMSGFYIVDGVLLSITGVENMIDNEGMLTLPSSVREIQAGAFYNIPNLKKLVIPGTVKVIHEGAFKNNQYLESIELKYGIETIANEAFYGCTSLTEIVIPDSVTKLGTSVFQNCSSLVSAVLPENEILYRLPGYTFSACTSLTSVTIPETITELLGGAFAACKNLTELYIHENISSMAGDPFSSCNKLIMTVDPNNQYYTMIEDDNNNYTLCNKEVTEIIHVCKQNEITSYEIPDGITSIVISSFTYLQELYVPASVTDLGSFYGTRRLSTVTIHEDNQYYSSDSEAVYNKDGTTLIRCTSQASTYTIKEHVKTIASNSFQGKTNLKTIIFSDSLETVERTSIYACSNLEKIVIGANLKSMTGTGLYNVPKLTEVEIRGNTNFSVSNGMILTDNGETLVKVLGNLESVTVPNTITKIGDGALNNMTVLTSVTLQDGLLYLGNYVFQACNALTSVVIPSTVIQISSSCFASSNNLSEIIIRKAEGSISGSPWGAEYSTKAIKWEPLI